MSIPGWVIRRSALQGRAAGGLPVGGKEADGQRLAGGQCDTHDEPSGATFTMTVEVSPLAYGEIW